MLALQSQQHSPDLAAILAEYRGGDADAAVATFASWPIAKVSVQPVPPAAENDPWALAALALLHTEVGFATGLLSGAPPFREKVAPDRDFAVFSRTASILCERLVEIARTRQVPGLLDFVQRWLVVAGSLGARNDFWGMVADPDFATRHFPESADVQLHVGSLFVELSGPRIHDGGMYGVGGDLPHLPPTVMVSTSHGNFGLERSRAAERALRSAIGNAPDLLEARLRLGWLLALLDRRSEAQQLLEETVTLAGRRGAAFEGYLASLFLGWLHANRNDAAAAIEHYRRAKTFMPDAPAAYLASGLARIERGDRGGWSEIRSVLTDDARPPVTDPWVFLPDHQYWQIGERLPALRAMVRTAPRPQPAATGVAIGRGSSPVTPMISARAALVEPSQAFRGVVEGVRIDAMVTDRGRPVAGLTAADFEILDNGIVQRLESASAAGHLSIALALDTSESVGHEFADLRRSADAVAEAMRAGDRISLLTFDDALALPLRDAAEPEAFRDALARQQSRKRTKTVLWDAVVGAAALVADAPGRPLVLVLGDALDNASWVTLSPKAAAPSREQDRLFEQLRRAAILVDTIWVPPDLRDDALNVRYSQLDLAVGRIPKLELARATGGEAHDGTKDLREVLRRRFEDLRQSYVLTFTPAGVKSGDGWHKLTVRLKGRSGQVRARPGYFSAPAR